VSVNKDKPHILVLPEDDANSRVANGFHLAIDPTRQRQMQVLEPAGGWRNVLDRFNSDHVPAMDRYHKRLMLLLIDFDGDVDRLEFAKSYIPERLADRVFILGSLNDPETLKAEIGTYETIGSEMARDCREETENTWGHDLLRHNASEIARLRQHVRPILF
jgi:hypothetical protein